MSDTHKHNASISSEQCEYRQHLQLLRELDHFGSLPMELTKVIAYLCARQTYKPGEPVFTQGETDSRAYYVLSGTAEVVRQELGSAGEPSGEKHVLGTLPAETFVGSLSLLSPTRRLFTLRAQTALTCVVLEREKLWPQLSASPQALASYIQACVAAVHGWEESHLLKNICDGHCTLDHAGVSIV